MNTLPLSPLSALRRDRSPQPAGAHPVAATSTPRLPVELGPPTLALAPGEVLSRTGVAGLHLRLRAGRAWVTEAHDAEDHFLGAGDTYTVRGAGLLVVEALGPEVAVLVWQAG
ncbi:DUF2917 domain-containing protein [Ideonella oryzae]|uniref:DUF2917 domain-containing protein n=1 Tax=Ideonella oryzae TaxID=2937441 RepID=A0ABT1BRC1_9BURK|nr:DUF2917 domain-containing protein [Ideonella oryzae]MCO5978469.1 DUF2917 domain-containing protein [Ideonella oryzae]